MNYKEYAISLLENNRLEYTIDKYLEPDTWSYGEIEITIYGEDYPIFCTIVFNNKEDIRKEIMRTIINEQL